MPSRYNFTNSHTSSQLLSLTTEKIQFHKSRFRKHKLSAHSITTDTFCICVFCVFPKKSLSIHIHSSTGHNSAHTSSRPSPVVIHKQFCLRTMVNDILSRVIGELNTHLVQLHICGGLSTHNILPSSHTDMTSQNLLT